MEKIFPWDRFRDWFHCIAIVAFDLELGQTLEVVYPHHARLTEEEKTNICYLSFPDSNSGCMGDTQFNFRIRHVPSKKDALENSRLGKIYNDKCPYALQIDHNFMNGYVYFRQVKDPSLRRGYFQKSVVLLSKLPFVNLYQRILDLLAPAYFQGGLPAVESACDNIQCWPPPIPGQMLNLRFFDITFEILIPTYSCVRTNGSPVKLKANPNPPRSSSPEAGVLLESTATVKVSSVHEPDLFLILKPLLSQIHLIWELVLTAEPIVVMATVPDVCANTVNALINTVFPLRYCADFRPYFTIHDSDFQEYTMKSTPPPPVVLGVTNPFFAKTLQHWPHIIRVGNDAGMKYATGGTIRKSGITKVLNSQPGVCTNYRPFLQKDKTLLKKILMGMESQRPGIVQTAILRRYLHELTESFMIPLERYMASLMPLQKNICPGKAAPLPRPFNPEEFLATLDVSGPQLTTGVKGEWSGLYKKFFRSTNFAEWYNLRYRESSEKLQALHLEAMAEADVESWISVMDEVETVDLILRLRHQMTRTHLPVKPDVHEKLQIQIKTIVKTLPEDLQVLLAEK